VFKHVWNAINQVLLSVLMLALAIGQLLFKHVGLTIRGMAPAHAASTLLREPALYAALALYGAATLLWIWILGRITLMQAYPWVGASVIIVSLMSSYFFGERVAPLFWPGAVLIALGIVLTQYSGRPG
jgi:drug/metabolite transporter (DMT)-like permease